MALTVECFMCATELDQPGALIFSPPNKAGNTKKRHLCVECFKLLEKYFKRIKLEARIRMGSHDKT